MKKIIILIITLCFLNVESQAQCYLKYTDASGLSLTTDEQKTLLDSACDLRDVFPTALRDSFAVVDFGFYAYNENMEGGYPEFMNLMTKRLAENPKTKYYLLFGRESSSARGPNSKIWVKVVLPKWGRFSCLSDMKRELVGIRCENKIDSVFKTNNISKIYNAELATIKSLKKQVAQIVDCCAKRETRGDMSCSLCDNADLNQYLAATNFTNFELKSEFALPIGINKPNIKDNSSFTTTIYGKKDFLGNHLEPYITELNKTVGINVQVVSNTDVCLGDLETLKQFTKEKEIGIQIVFDKATKENPKNLNIELYWNENNKRVFKNKEEADVYLTTLKGYILRKIDFYPDGVIVDGNPGLQDRLKNLLNQYMGIPDLFDLKINAKGYAFFKVRPLKPGELTDPIKLKFYRKIDDYAIVGTKTLPDKTTVSYKNVIFHLVDEDISANNKQTKEVDGKVIDVDDFNAQVLDVGDLEKCGFDFAHSFFHAVYEQFIFLTKIPEWTGYITDKITGKLFDDPDSDNPYYGICHAKTVEEELNVFGYAYPRCYDDPNKDGIHITRKAVDKAKFVIIDSDKTTSGKTYQIDTSGHKIIFILSTEFKSAVNKTYIKYEKQKP